MLISCWNIIPEAVNKRFLAGRRIVFEQLTCNILIYNIFLSPDLLKTLWLAVGYKSEIGIIVSNYTFLTVTLE
jgi:hypothetical protein